MIEGIVFDWDGVIANTEELHRLAFSKVLKAHGRQKEIPREEWVEYCGVGDEGTSKLLLEHNEIELDWKMLFEEKNNAYEQMLDQGIGFMPGFKELYALVKERNLKRIVCTGSERKYIDRTIKALGLYNELQYVCVADVGKAKSEPDVFLLACERIKLKPEQCVLIEDGITGINTGNRLGMRTVFLKTYGQSSNADLEIDSLSELVKEFKAILS
ncbi:HAD family phosphatase [archaeon]|nr:HAD family phosphatase [archaeon]